MTPFVAELIGTMTLIVFGNGVVANVVLSRTKGNAGGWIVITFGWGMAVFVAVFCTSKYSGAHLNPAVTIGLAAAGKFGDTFFKSWADVPLYIGAQMIGGFLGACVVYLVYKDHFDATDDPAAKLACFATGPAIRNPLSNLISEVVGTVMLILPIFLMIDPSFAIDLGTGTSPKTTMGLGALGALPVGLLVFAIGLSLGGTTGYAINPARDLAPRLAHALLPIRNKGTSDWPYAWIPVVGPVVGALVAAGLARLLIKL